jgi:mono/diheme cytochrome c family protein
LAAICAGVLLTGCHLRLPGQPTAADRWRAPAEVNDFPQLYAQNCAGCHGAGGKNGAARSLNDALYLALVPDDELRKVIADGRTNTTMPAFSQQTGGSLSDGQIALLITGMRANWAKPDDFRGVTLPAYSVTATPGSDQSNPASSQAATPNDPNQGEAAYQTYCARCHGADGAGGTAGSIVDPNYLNLVSDQGLRTTVVVGRADLGKPDWRANVPGRTMSPQEIDEVVAWIAAQRKANRTTAIQGGGLAGANPK